MILLCMISLVVIAGCATRPAAHDYRAGFKDGYTWVQEYYKMTPTPTDTPGYNEGFFDGGVQARRDLSITAKK